MAWRGVVGGGLVDVEEEGGWGLGVRTDGFNLEALGCVPGSGFYIRQI